MPYYRFQINTSRSPEDVMAKLESIIYKPRDMFESMSYGYRNIWDAGGDEAKATLPFVGTVKSDSFHVHRVIYYNNSFLPRIYGDITLVAGGTKISIVMYMHPLVTIFVLSWLWFLVKWTWPELVDLHLNSPIHPFTVGVFFFVIAVVGGAFFVEALKARRLLEEALES